MVKKLAGGRGHIRQRGNSFQVLMYAGVDPLAGRELRLTESTTEEAEAKGYPGPVMTHPGRLRVRRRPTGVRVVPFSPTGADTIDVSSESTAAPAATPMAGPGWWVAAVPGLSK